jgi:hypothetical protein
MARPDWNRNERVAFIREYSDVLLSAVLNGGKEEFCKPVPEWEGTAVGGYVAFLAFASSQDSGVSDLITNATDKRVVQILIDCLGAPDNVFRDDQGMGKPVESTGRNVQRQSLPWALILVNATEAIPKLREILFTHHDYYLREFSAEALGKLMPRDGRTDVEGRLLTMGPEGAFAISKGHKTKHLMKMFLFPFGRGLLARGIDDGIRYMSFEYSFPTADGFEDRELISLLQQAEDRVPLVQKIRSPKVEPFYSEMLTNRSFRAIFTFSPDEHIIWVGYEHGTSQQRDPAEGMKEYESRILSLYDGILAGLRLNGIHVCDKHIADIGQKTRNAGIRKRSEDFLVGKTP